MAHNPIADSGTTLASASGASSQSSAMAVKTDSLQNHSQRHQKCQRCYWNKSNGNCE